MLELFERPYNIKSPEWDVLNKEKVVTFFFFLIIFHCTSEGKCTSVLSVMVLSLFLRQLEQTDEWGTWSFWRYSSCNWTIIFKESSTILLLLMIQTIIDCWLNVKPLHLVIVTFLRADFSVFISQKHDEKEGCLPRPQAHIEKNA